jgi:hypothetical protein
MIPPVGSSYSSSPVYIPAPDFSDVQRSSELSSPKKTGLKRGIAEYQDSFEQQKEIYAQEKIQNDLAKAAEVENERKKYARLTLETDLIDKSGNKLINHYEKLKTVDAAEKSEQTKGFHRDQPIANAAADAASLDAHIKANILSMIRV